MAAGDTTAAPTPSARPSLVESLLPGILGRAKVVISPYPFATQDDDSLRVTVVNSLPSVTVEVHGRLVTRAGDAVPFRCVVTPTSDRMATTRDFPLAGGFVSNLSTFAAGGSPLIGQTFVIVQIVRGASLSAFVLGTLLSAYVTSTQPIGWPGTPIQSSIDGGGYVRHVAGTQPAAGANINEAVPTGARWELLSFNVNFQASAAAGNRLVRLQFSAGATPFWFSQSTGAIAPGTSLVTDWAEGSPYIGATDTVVVNAALPQGVSLLAGDSIRSFVTALAPDDQFFQPIYTVKEWLEAN